MGPSRHEVVANGRAESQKVLPTGLGLGRARQTAMSGRGRAEKGAFMSIRGSASIPQALHFRSDSEGLTAILGSPRLHRLQELLTVKRGRDA